MNKSSHILPLLLLFISLVGHCLANIGPIAPTIVEKQNFDAESEAEQLKTAIKEENAENITKIICSLSNRQRQLMAKEIDVIGMLNLSLDHNYRKLMIALMKPPGDYDANQMHHAITHKKHWVMVEILATRTNQQIDELKNAYSQLGKELEKGIEGRELKRDIETKTFGSFRLLLLHLLESARDESTTTDEIKAQEDANKLIEKRKKEFYIVFAQRNFDQLRKIFEYYKQTTNGIEEGIQNSFICIETIAGFLAMVQYAEKSAEYFATLLHEYLNSNGKENTDLIRLFVSRSEIDLADIKTAYNGMHKASLEQRIKDTTHEPFKDALLALLRGNISTTVTTDNVYEDDEDDEKEDNEDADEEDEEDNEDKDEEEDDQDEQKSQESVMFKPLIKDEMNSEVPK